MKSLSGGFVVAILLLASAVGLEAQGLRSRLTFDNQSGEPALVKLVGPTAQTVEVPNGEKRTVNVATGEYYLLARYGADPRRYTYSRGDPFMVEETATQYSAITITLHKVVGGNYPTRPISGKEFDKAIAASREPQVKQSHAPSVTTPSSTATSPSPTVWTVESAETNKPILIPLTRLIKEGRILRGNPSGMTSLAISPDGRILASGSHSKVMLWDLATGNGITTLVDRSFWVYALAFSPDGRILASGENRQINLWDVATWNRMKTLRDEHNLTDAVRSIAFSPDGKILASGAWGDEHIIVWDVATGNKIQTLRAHTGYVLSVAFSPDGKILASRGRDSTIILWDVATWNSLRTLEDISSEEGERGIAFSPDGKILASGGRNRTVILWNVATGGNIMTLKGHPGAVGSVTFSPGGRMILASADDATGILWDVATGNEIKTLKYSRGTHHLIAFSPDGNILASAIGKSVILTDIGAFLALSGGAGENLTKAIEMKRDEEIKRVLTRGEFETTREYEERIKTTKPQEDIIRKRHAALIKEAKDRAEKELDKKRAKLYPHSLEINLGKYDADREVFETEVEGNKILIQVPREKAKEIRKDRDKVTIEGMLRYFDSERAELVSAFMMEERKDESVKAPAGKEYPSGTQEVAQRKPVPTDAPVTGGVQQAFAIKDDKFIDRSIPDGNSSDVAIRRDSSGEMWTLSRPPGKDSFAMAFYGGKQVLWSNGSTHTWLDKNKVFGYTFDSDKDDPLQFRVDRDKGYVYVKGKGTVTMPDGKTVKLPQNTDAGSSSITPQRDEETIFIEASPEVMAAVEKLGSKVVFFTSRSRPIKALTDIQTTGSQVGVWGMELWDGVNAVLQKAGVQAGTGGTGLVRVVGDGNFANLFLGDSSLLLFVTHAYEDGRELAIIEKGGGLRLVFRRRAE